MSLSARKLQPALELVPYEPSHRVALELQLSDARVSDWLPFAHPPERAEIDHMLGEVGQEAKGGFQFWMAEDRNRPQAGFIGAIGMQATGYRHLAQLFYWVLPDFQCCGYGTEMVRLLRETLLDDWGYARAQALVAPDNHASIRVLEKAGFEREGLLRRYFIRKFANPDDLMDVYMYATVKE